MSTLTGIGRRGTGTGSPSLLGLWLGVQGRAAIMVTVMVTVTSGNLNFKRKDITIPSLWLTVKVEWSADHHCRLRQHSCCRSRSTSRVQVKPLMATIQATLCFQNNFKRYGGFKNLCLATIFSIFLFNYNFKGLQLGLWPRKQFQWTALQLAWPGAQPPAGEQTMIWKMAEFPEKSSLFTHPLHSRSILLNVDLQGLAYSIRRVNVKLSSQNCYLFPSGPKNFRCLNFLFWYLLKVSKKKKFNCLLFWDISCWDGFWPAG